MAGLGDDWEPQYLTGRPVWVTRAEGSNRCWIDRAVGLSPTVPIGVVNAECYAGVAAVALAVLSESR
jgi:hypothetical protein